MSDDGLSEKGRRVKEAFIRERGGWPPIYDLLIAEDPDFLETIMRYQRDVAETNALDPKTRELIGIAVNVSAPHLYARSAASHIRGALAAGATAAEIIGVLKVVSQIGLQSFAEALPILEEALAERA